MKMATEHDLKSSAHIHHIRTCQAMCQWCHHTILKVQSAVTSTITISWAKSFQQESVFDCDFHVRKKKFFMQISLIFNVVNWICQTNKQKVWWFESDLCELCFMHHYAIDSGQWTLFVYKISPKILLMWMQHFSVLKKYCFYYIMPQHILIHITLSTVIQQLITQHDPFHSGTCHTSFWLCHRSPPFHKAVLKAPIQNSCTCLLA